ncbi:MAG: hypothetical protein Q9M19_03960 [Mariprofundaceae bacterium]|nr:hypothetical protein [Mariprofundaceae bacterium]
MAKKRVPGQRSSLALLLSSIWTILGLFVLIVGHVIIVFYIYGKMDDSDALAELAAFIPFLEPQYFYIVAGLAILVDIWAIISQKRAYEKQFQR